MSFMTRYGESRKVSLEEAGRIGLHAGECCEIRDFTLYMKPETWKAGGSGAPGEWGVRDYLLLDGTKGRMLYANFMMPPEEDAPLPPVVEMDLPLKGLFEIWLAAPLLEERPVMSEFGRCTGVDAALNDAPFTAVSPEFGCRLGRLLGETGREYWCLYRTARLDGGRLRIRIPFGTRSMMPLDFVRAFLSAVCFMPVEETAVSAPDKEVGIISDGFSAYAMWGVEGECFDLRLPEIYQDSDVKDLYVQIAGPTLWKSRVNNYWGENLTEADFAGKRACDIRSIRYVRWSVEQGMEALRAQAEACHRLGMRMHLSIRANLYWPEDSKFMTGHAKYMNGEWWFRHPECRLPDSDKLDYGRREVRDYYLALFREALEQFELDGINLDLTRWPPVLDAKRHDTGLLVEFVREMRALADGAQKRNGRHVAVSLTMVDGYHAKCGLMEQAIDFEKLAASGALDFVNLQAYDLTGYAGVAHRYGMKLYGVLESDSPYYPDGRQSDPLWRLGDGQEQDDPVAGEERLPQPPLVCSASIQEKAMCVRRFYRQGADGVAISNHPLGQGYFRDYGHSEAVARHVREGTAMGIETGNYLFVR